MIGHINNRYHRRAGAVPYPKKPRYSDCFRRSRHRPAAVHRRPGHEPAGRQRSRPAVGDSRLLRRWYNFSDRLVHGGRSGPVATAKPSSSVSACPSTAPSSPLNCSVTTGNRAGCHGKLTIGASLVDDIIAAIALLFVRLQP